MPRSMVTDPDDIARAILFGTKLQPVNLEELSKLTGISRSTLCGYKREPRKIPLNRLAKITARRGLTDQELADLLSAYRRK